ncbi:MAG: CDP-alcohol phosphatidyltransferase family protein [Propionibacteriaceae bacterium]|jgi:CDP-diacylglycerol--glycerol-3-phosphate 3-phosphatidyltransferase|nr:CDP-alcohol phosphatidyltransferase family protein [Propionibacteriaceae bacterium]
MRHVPNVLVVIRILCAPWLPFLASAEHRVAFVALYLFCYLTDIADGWIARKFDAASVLGSALDSIGDFVLGSAAVASLAVATDLLTSRTTLVLLFANLAFRLVTLLVTWFKFHVLATVHTWGAKVTTGALHVGVLTCLWLGRMWLPMVVLVAAIALVGAAEQLAITVTARAFDSDRKSLLSRPKTPVESAL